MPEDQRRELEEEIAALKKEVSTVVLVSTSLGGVLACSLGALLLRISHVRSSDTRTGKEAAPSPQVQAAAPGPALRWRRIWHFAADHLGRRWAARW